MQTIDRILELTQQVQEQADEGAWAEAGALDLERRRLLNELLAENDIAALAPNTQALLRDILAQNDRIISAVQNRKGELVEASGRLNRAAGAVRAYRQNTASTGWAGSGTAAAKVSE